MKPVLLIMAAGLGSRYGGLKQIDPVGPNGEILLEFALKDAIKIGMEEVIVIVSESIRADFDSMMVSKYAPQIKITLVTQTLDALPEGYTKNPERTKPWWTGHAVWCARDVISGPFVVMNADDYYGHHALKQAYDFLLAHTDSGEHCIITCPLAKMLSEFGTVSRGICEVVDGKMTHIVEHTKVGYKDGKIIHTCEDGTEITLTPETPANMNLFGFQKSIFDVIDSEFDAFLQEYHNEIKREFYLLTAVQSMIDAGTGSVSAIGSVSEWFGMTNPEDRLEAKNKIQALIDQGAYL